LDQHKLNVRWTTLFDVYRTFRFGANAVICLKRSLNLH